MASGLPCTQNREMVFETMHVRRNELDGSDDDGEADGGGKMG